MIIPLQFFFEEISRETFDWIELSYEIITNILILNFLLKKEKKFFESKASSEKIRYSLIIKSFVIGLLLLVISRFIYSNCSHLFDYELTESLKSSFDLGLIPIIISSTFIAPVFEEIFFRQYLFQKLLQRHGLKLSIITSSLLFALSHLPNIYSFITSLFIGLLCATLLYSSKNIIYSIVLHFSWNFIINLNDIFYKVDLLSFMNYNSTMSILLFMIALIGLLLLLFSQIKPILNSR